MKRAWVSLVAIAALAQLAACAPGSGSGSTSWPIGPAPADAHVFVIVMENASFSQAIAQPYAASLAARYAVATNYRAVAHPSLPNYLALTAGQTFGIHDDRYHRLPMTGLGAELSANGVSWRAYMEGFTGDCFSSPYPYSLKHNPFAYYGGSCPSNVVSLAELQTDLAGTTPRLSWITPGLCHDGHDCSRAVADQWLSGIVPQITGSPAWQRDGVLLITWDEAGFSFTNQVATLVITPHPRTHRLEAAYTHYSLLAAVADRLGVARPGGAAQADPIAIG